LEKESSREGFWSDSQKAAKTMRKLEDYRKFVKFWGNIEKEAAELLEMSEVLGEDAEEGMRLEIEQKTLDLEALFAKNEFQVLMNGKYDEADAIVTLRSGAGGVDAQDFTEMLFRMYLRYCEIQGYKAEIVQQSRGEEAGVKSVIFLARGAFAYGYLKNEMGVHRLVRLSPFNADHLRQTSFASVEVLPEIAEGEEVEIKDEDIRIDTYRSSGAGGQSVNKTDSAVRITHIQTGIVVACQNERSQMQNKEQAMNILRSKIYALQEEAKQKEQQALRGEYKSAEWGNQIRSYVVHPYKMVKDHRTKLETTDVESVLNGEIQDFIEARIKQV
jgi:peptide chain release factor 2